MISKIQDMIGGAFDINSDKLRTFAAPGFAGLHGSQGTTFDDLVIA